MAVVAAAAALLAAGIAVEVVTGSGQSLRVAAGDLIAGVALGWAGVVATALSPRRLVGPLLVLASALWFAATLAASSAATLASFGTAVGSAYRGALVCAVLLATCRYRSPVTLAVACLAWIDTLITPLSGSAIATLMLAAAVLLAALIAPRDRPRLAAPVLLALALGGPAVARLVGEVADTGNRVLLAADMAIALTAAVTAGAVIADRRREDRLPDRLIELASGAGLGSALAYVLHDPDVRLFAADSAPAASPGREHTVLRPPGGPIVIEHAQGALDAESLRRGVTSAILLQRAHEQRSAELATATSELLAAQRRIVVAAGTARARLRRRLERDAIAHAERLGVRLAQTASTAGASAELSSAIAELRTLADGLHPTALTRDGLAGALGRLARSAGTEVTVDVGPTRYLDEVELVVYFVCAEALANAIKHAHAQRASISVGEQAGELVATVIDDGVGGADLNGSGIAGLAARAGALSGRVQVTSPVGGGTRVCLSIPV